MQLFVEQLTNVDFSYLDPERGLVGETWWAGATLDGALDEQGMICDFGTVKKILRNWLDDEVDHRLLVPLRHPALSWQAHEDHIELTWHFAEQTLQLSCPQQALALVDAESIDASSVATWCRTQLQPFFPVNVEQLALTFTPEHITGASYHYSHGLKKHDGNCQRIAHGHRSRIHIWLDNQRNEALEQHWAERWADIYLVSEEDIIDDQNGQLSTRYQSAQGAFAMSLPSRACYRMNTDTTVEFIAQHLADAIKAEHPTQAVRVQAFEGVNKGAIASA